MTLRDFRFLYSLMTPAARRYPVGNYRGGQLSQAARIMIAAANDGVLTVRKEG